MRETAARKGRLLASLAAAFGVLLAAGAAEASLPRDAAHTDLLAPRPVAGAAAPGDIAALATDHQDRGFRLLGPTPPHPAAFSLVPDLVPALERLWPGKLASGLEPWEPRVNVWQIKEFASIRWWASEKYQAFGLDPQNNTDPLGLATDWNSDPAALAFQAAQAAQATRDRQAREEQKRRERAEEAAKIAELAARIQTQRAECSQIPCMSAQPSNVERQRVAGLWDAYWGKVRRDALPAVVAIEAPNMIATVLGVKAGAAVWREKLSPAFIGPRPAPQLPSEAVPTFHESPEMLVPQGNFSIFDWSGYPEGLPRPQGPFRLLQGPEYEAARKAANQANRLMHRQDPSLAGRQIHEIHPVKFAGSPVDQANKVPLLPAEHAPVTTWWNQLMQDMTGPPNGGS